MIEIDKLEKAAFILKTVAHPVRLRIIELLDQNGPMTVSDLCEALDCEQSLTSHHLSNMKYKGILQSQRSGKNIHYSLKERDVTKILGCLENCGCNMG